MHRQSHWIRDALVAIFVSTLATTVASTAQAFECSTSGPVDDFLLARGASTPLSPTIDSATLRIYVHVLRRSDGTGGWSDSEVDAMVSAMRLDFEALDIHLVEVGRSDFADDRYYSFNVGVANDWHDPAENGVLHSDAIDVMLGIRSATAKPLAFGNAADFGSASFYAFVDDPASEFRVLSHEMGHCLGLYHTHHGSLPVICGDEPGPCVELVDGSNCETCGDFVCDTPASPNLGECGGLVNANCEYQVPAGLAQANPELLLYSPSTTNIMAYTPITCMSEFTPGQLDRMFATIELEPRVQAVTVPDPSIAIFDETSTSGLQNSTKAYAVTFKDYVSGDPGFSVSFDTGATKHYRRYGFAIGVPQHSNEATGQGFSSTPSERGMSVADYDGDSDLDVFVAHEFAPRLYEKRTGTPPYVDVADSVAVGTTTFYLATLDSWSGAWGDYDGDGHSDLYVSRADAPSTGNRHTYSSIDGQGAKDVLLHNRGYAGVGFDDVTATSGIYDVISETVSASWADVDNDQDLDLFVCWLGGLESGMTMGWSPLYVNNGDGTFTDQSFVAGNAGSSPSPEFPRLGYVNGVAWPDMNNDGYVDIALARENSTGTGNTQNVLVCINKGDADPGSLIDEPSGRPNSTEPMSDLRVADLDNNTVADLIYSPTGTATEHVYMGYASEAGTVWVEQAGTLGLTGTPGGTLLAADLNDDGDTDLFLGDSYWKMKSADGSESNGNNYIKVGLQNNSRLGGTWNSGNAFEGVGARVLLECPATGVLPALTKTFMVDGGSGRGGQNDRLVTIGLGGRESGTLTVFWPDGSNTVQTFTNTDINNASSPIDIADVHAPSLVGSTVTGYTQPNPDGTMNWVFEWKTDHTIDESLDKIVVRPKAGKFGVPPLCQMTETTLRPTTYKVDHTVVASGTRLLHKLVWEDQNCNAPCTYTFDVYSTFNGDVDSKLVTQLDVPVCVQQQ